MNLRPFLSSAVLLLIALKFTACKEDEIDTSITFDQIVLETSDGTDRVYSKFSSSQTISVEDYGFVYAQQAGVTMENGTKVSVASGATTTNSEIMLALLELDRSTDYYINAYVVKENGEVAYGAEGIFKTVAGNRWMYANWPAYLGPAAYNTSVLLVGTDLYIAGGVKWEGSQRNEQFFKYDFVTNTHTRLPDYPGPIASYSPFFSIGNKIYLLSVEGTTYAYDIDQKRWARKADIPIADPDLIDGFAIGSKGYAGIGGTSEQNDFYSFDPSNASDGVDEFGEPIGKWTPVADYIGIGHFRNFAFSHQGKGYVLNAGVNVTLNAYDPLTNVWSQVAVYPGNKPQASSGRIEGFAFVVGDKLYVYPGQASTEPKNPVWTYDLNSGMWEEITGENQNNILANSGFNYAFSFNGDGYVWDETTLAKYIAQ